MICLGPYEMFFFHLMFYFYQILYFSSSNYLNAYILILILTIALWNAPPQKFCVVYLSFTGYQMKA